MSGGAGGVTPRRRRSPRGLGDELRTELVAAARRLLSTAESAAHVSVRAVAADVGVSPVAIYLHFTDKQDLLDAVTREVFLELDDTLDIARGAIPDPVVRLCEQGLRYVRFALEHRYHYRHAMLEKRLRGEASDTVAPWGLEAAHHRFCDTAQDCVDGGAFIPVDPAVVGLAFWSLAHGVAALQIARPELPWRDSEAFARRAMRSAAVSYTARDQGCVSATERVDRDLPIRPC